MEISIRLRDFSNLWVSPNGEICQDPEFSNCSDKALGPVTRQQQTADPARQIRSTRRIRVFKQHRSFNRPHTLLRRGLESGALGSDCGSSWEAAISGPS